MRTMLSWIAVFLLIHLAAGGAFLWWLKSSDRLTWERVESAAKVFGPTVAEERAAKEAEEKAQLEAAARSAEAARLEAVSKGPRTLVELIGDTKERESVVGERVERMRREIADLQRQLSLAQDLLAKQKHELESERAAMEKRWAQAGKASADRDFQKTVELYEQLKPRQTKQMFAELIKTGKTDQVVEYLAAMQLRKAAAVVKEFKEGDEVGTATMLVQRLRERGVELRGVGGSA